jgi:hypothetical protein
MKIQATDNDSLMLQCGRRSKLSPTQFEDVAYAPNSPHSVRRSLDFPADFRLQKDKTYILSIMGEKQCSTGHSSENSRFSTDHGSSRSHINLPAHFFWESWPWRLKTKSQQRVSPHLALPTCHSKSCNWVMQHPEAEALHTILKTTKDEKVERSQRHISL